VTLTRGAGTMFRLRAGCTFARTCWRSHGEIIQDEAEPVHGARAKLGILAPPTAALSLITPAAFAQGAGYWHTKGNDCYNGICGSQGLDPDNMRSKLNRKAA
jgi:hypothetical protein